MLKTITSFFLLILTFTNAYSQIESSIEDKLPLNIITGNNIFFNRLELNPTLWNDSSRIETYIIAQNQIAGYDNSPQKYDFGAAGFIPKTKSHIGININTYKNGDFKNQSIKINYGYRYKLNEKSSIKAGVRLSLSRFKSEYDDILWIEPDYSDWYNYQNVDFGISYNILNHCIGVSYVGIIRNQIISNNSKHDFSDNLLMINYLSSYNLNASFKIIPELILYKDIQETNAILKGNLMFRNKYSLGLLLDKSANYSFMVKALFLKHIELGYVYEYVKDNNINGINSFKLGLIL